MRLEFSSVAISFFIHATEDEARLLSNVSSKIGLAGQELKSDVIAGHFGNKITSGKAHGTGMNAQKIASFILANLSPGGKSKLLKELDKSMDEHDALYLRIDRQLIDEYLSLSDQEPIRIKLKPKSRAGGRETLKKGYIELIK